jgi:hypothetical protein
VKNKGGSANYWWERSPRSGSSYYFCLVTGNGRANHNAADSGSGVAFGFCV